MSGVLPGLTALVSRTTRTTPWPDVAPVLEQISGIGVTLSVDKKSGKVKVPSSLFYHSQAVSTCPVSENLVFLFFFFITLKLRVT